MATNESSKTVFLAMSVNFSIGIAKSIIATITFMLAGILTVLITGIL